MTRRMRGMTLVEVLVAVALLSLLAVGMLSAYQIGNRSYERVTRFDRMHDDIALAQRWLRGALESAYPLQAATSTGEHGFEAGTERLEFTAPSPFDPYGWGLRRFALRLAQRTDGLWDLEVVSRLDRNGAGPRAEVPVTSEVLVSRVERIEWAFQEGGVDSVEAEAPWLTAWTQPHLPGLIRLRIQFPKADARTWPDLIVAPRVDTDANCRFDSISQTCRGGRS